MAIKEENVSIAGMVLLQGTYALPQDESKKYPGMLIIPGSGKIDRDGNVKRKFEFNLYRDLAHLVAGSGFVTLRYDKRGVGESEGDALKAGLWDFVFDAGRALETLKKHPNVDPDKIIIMGHSEGCTTATALNAKTPVDGLILLSGAAEPLEMALQRQRDILHKELNETKGCKGWLIRALKVTEKSEKNAQAVFKKMMESTEDVIKLQIFFPMPAKYFREHFSYNVMEDLKKVTCPLLALGGDKDFQTNVERMKLLPEYVKGDVEYYTIKDMDHGLKKQEAKISASTYKKDYMSTIGKPIHEEAVEKITDWLSKHFKDRLMR